MRRYLSGVTRGLACALGKALKEVNNKDSVFSQPFKFRRSSKNLYMRSNSRLLLWRKRWRHFGELPDLPLQPCSTMYCTMWHVEKLPIIKILVMSDDVTIQDCNFLETVFSSCPTAAGCGEPIIKILVIRDSTGLYFLEIVFSSCPQRDTWRSCSSSKSSWWVTKQSKNDPRGEWQCRTVFFRNRFLLVPTAAGSEEVAHYQNPVIHDHTGL